MQNFQPIINKRKDENKAKGKVSYKMYQVSYKTTKKLSTIVELCKKYSLKNLLPTKHITTMKPTGKIVKLQGKHRDSNRSMYYNKSVPWLTTSGVWLQKLGFNIGDTVRITAENKKLIIEITEEN